MNHQILWSQHNAVPSDSGYLVSTNYQTSNPLMKTSTENYLADHQATVAMVSDRKAEFNPHSQMGAVALKESTVLPRQNGAGATWFQREGKRDDMVLRVPVGDVVYEFPFSFSKEKEKANQQPTEFTPGVGIVEVAGPTPRIRRNPARLPSPVTSMRGNAPSTSHWGVFFCCSTPNRAFGRGWMVEFLH